MNTDLTDEIENCKNELYNSVGRPRLDKSKKN